MTDPSGGSLRTEVFGRTRASGSARALLAVHEMSLGNDVYHSPNTRGWALVVQQ